MFNSFFFELKSCWVNTLAKFRQLDKYSNIYAQYDLDDNIFFLPTKIICFEKHTLNPVAISTETFAKVRNQIGKESVKIMVTPINNILTEDKHSDTVIDLMNYQVIYENDASFSQFRDDSDLFISDLKIAIKNKAFGPSFKDFQEHCLNKASAKNIKIITARGQSPETIHQGFVYLKDLGLIKYTPEIKNIVPVMYKNLEPKEFRAEPGKPQEAKIKVLETVLDEIESHAHITNASFGFSDDDYKTFEQTKCFLTEQINKGRWTKVQINLYFTGNKNMPKQRHKLTIK